MLSSGRGGEFARTIAQDPRSSIEIRLQERRFLPQSLRNVAVLFRDGSVSVVGPLESAQLPEDFFRSLPMGGVSRRVVGNEEYILYAAPIGQNRTIVLYESQDFLAGPQFAVFVSLFFGILAFSVILFFISLSFARKVIRPIEELADRERAYARHIAHELKTPLAVAKSDLQLALVEKETAQDRILSAVAEIGSMRDTVDDLLLFSASGSLARTVPTDIRKLLSELVAKSEFGSRFDVSHDPDAPETVESDSKILSTLFRNLISNAIVHAPADARISVRFSKGGFAFSNPAPDADPKVIRHAFEAFVGTPGKGSGIGLSLVKRIAEAHGWKTSAELKNGRVAIGITF
ncbi:MAG: hypothetical protein QG650_1174 [Patescibacteria group bacterium]|nr:hypothetical protein [Patescibacteria group bacterium]